jgi:uroporphyrinogen-III synthase
LAVRVLLTRPLDDALPLKGRLEAMGCTVTLAPLMTIEYRSAPVSLEGMQALLFTSANGVRAFARLSSERDMPVYAVGLATGMQAEQAGFTAIHISGGDAVALAADVVAAVNPGDGPLLHIAGSVTRGDLGGRLERAGFTCRKQELYAAEPVSHLPAPARKGLEAGAFDAVLFYSPRTARLFRARVAEAGLEDRLGETDAYTLGPAITEALAGLTWRRVLTADRPEESVLLALMGLGG